MINLLPALTGFSLQSCFPGSRPPACDGAWKSFQSVKRKIRVTFTKWPKSSWRPPFRGALSVSHMLTNTPYKTCWCDAASYCLAAMVRTPECVFSFSPCPSCPVQKACYREEKWEFLLITLVSARTWHKAFFYWATGVKIHRMASFYFTFQGKKCKPIISIQRTWLCKIQSHKSTSRLQVSTSAQERKRERGGKKSVASSGS